MKRSKMFLGMTTCFLAIAGVVAAKANHFGSSIGYYRTGGATSQCVQATSSCLYTTTGLSVCHTNAGAGVRTYYTQLNANGTCQNKLIYNEQ